MNKIEALTVSVLAMLKSQLPDLTNRQMALVLLVNETPPLPAGYYDHTVRGLAKKIGVSKAVISRAVDALTALGLVGRRPDEFDGRNVFIVPGPDAPSFLASLNAVLA